MEIEFQGITNILYTLSKADCVVDAKSDYNQIQRLYLNINIKVLNCISIVTLSYTVIYLFISSTMKNLDS